MTPSVKYVERPGRLLIGAIWDNAQVRQRRLMLWDVPHARRRAFLVKQVAESEHSMAALFCGHMALAWAQPTIPGGLTYGLHFFCSGACTASETAAAGAEFIASFPHGACLMAVIPQAFVGAAGILTGLGFERVLAMPGALLVNGRKCGGSLYARYV